MRASSLTNSGVASDYYIDSDYDKVLQLAAITQEIQQLAPYATEIATLVANLPDITTIAQAQELINNLTVVATTLPAGSNATATLVGTEIRLGIPRGNAGVAGANGVTPIVEFTIDGSGNLQYEVTGWIDVNTNNTVANSLQAPGEW